MEVPWLLPHELWVSGLDSFGWANTISQEHYLYPAGHCNDSTNIAGMLKMVGHNVYEIGGL